MTSIDNNRYFLRAARVVLASSDDVIVDGCVEVLGQRIGRVGSVQKFAGEFANGTRVVDYGDATLMPGLIDAHCHMTLTGDGSTYEQQVLDPDEMMSLISVNNLSRHLASGVTTIRDNGGRNRVVFAVREAVERGYIVGPRMLLSGRPVTHSQGHFHWCNGAADGHDQIRAAVRRLVAEGADHIKIMASGGGTAGGLPYYPSYATEELRTAVESAHDLGRLTTAHCRASASMINAVEAGLDCIEHAEFLVPPVGVTSFGGGKPDTGLMSYDPKITEQILKARHFISFTAQAGGHETLLRLRAKLGHEQLTSEEERKRSAIEAYFEMKLDVLSSLLGDGMLPYLAISSDAGPFDVAFGGLQHGLELAVTAGMNPIQAIRSATHTAARLCGIEEDVGAVSTGKIVDLLLVRGDATKDVSAMWQVLGVYKDGRLVAPLKATSGVDEIAVSLAPRRLTETLLDC